jgi:Glycosyltransferase family 87
MSKWQLPSWARSTWFLSGLVLLLTVAISAQSIVAGVKYFDGSRIEYTHYNNYVIFRQSFAHLVAGRDLYVLYPTEYRDLFKYSPAFALFMAPLAVVPDFLGLVLWNLCNAGVLCVALWSLPSLTASRRLFALAFVAVEMVTSLQSAQSNALIAGLLILAFVQLERKQVFLATLCISLTVAIKLFGIVAFALLLLYPGRGRAAFYAIAWLALLALLPLVVVDPAQLEFLFRSWFDMLRHDEGISRGLSVAGWLFTWFGREWKVFSLVAGVALFCAPLARLSMYRDQRFRALVLASTLIWVVIFNHKAESPTYVIAVAGVAIWCVYSQRTAVNVALLVLTFVFTVLATTDVFPRAIKTEYLIPYVLKAVPCILVWLKVVADQLTMPLRADVAA